MHFPPVGKMKTQFFSLTEGREKGKYISSSQVKILTFSLLKIKDIKEKTYIKKLIFSWHCCCFFFFRIVHFLLSFFLGEGKGRDECYSWFWQHFIYNEFQSFLAALDSQSSIMASFLCISLEEKREDCRHGLFLAYGSRSDMFPNNGSWAENRIEVVVDRWVLNKEYHWHTVPTPGTHRHFIQIIRGVYITK